MVGAEGEPDQVHSQRQAAGEQTDYPQHPQAGPVARVGQLGEQHARQPREHHPFGHVRHQTGAHPDGPERRHHRQDQQHDEEDVRGQVGGELDDGHLAVLVADRQREEHPDRRTGEECEEEANRLPVGPVEVAAPHLRQIALHGRVGDYLPARTTPAQRYHTRYLDTTYQRCTYHALSNKFQLNMLYRMTNLKT